MVEDMEDVLREASEGCIVEDVLAKAEKRAQRKRKNSGDKGDRGELELAKLLNKQFGSQIFSRTSGSGNRWSHVASVKMDYIGDIVTPDDFRFVVECKHGYADDIDLYGALEGGNSLIDEWIDRAEEDSKLAHRPPIICWRKEWHTWLSFVKTTILSSHFDYEIKYRDWTGTPLANLFSLGKDFWFNVPSAICN
jgi:hypothetical protein